MKEGAEKVELKIQAKVESLKNANEGDKGTQMDQILLFCFPFRFVSLCFPCQGYFTEEKKTKKFKFILPFSFAFEFGSCFIFPILNCHTHKRLHQR